MRLVASECFPSGVNWAVFQLCRDGKFPTQPTVPCAVHLLLEQVYVFQTRSSCMLSLPSQLTFLLSEMGTQNPALYNRRLFQPLAHRIHEVSFPFYRFGRSCSLIALQASSPSVNPDQNPTQTTTVFKSFNQAQETSFSSEIFIFSLCSLHLSSTFIPFLRFTSTEMS